MKRYSKIMLPLSQKVGRLFVWGFDGTTVPGPFRALLRKYPPAGVILFKRNLVDPRQIKHLTSQIQSAVGRDRPILIGIDEEGGRVRRMPEPFIKFPPAEFFGRVYERQKDSRLLEGFGRMLARELLSIGINTNFAPVLDVSSNPKNPIIGDRAFSSDPKVVAQAALAFFSGMEKEGLIACGKHFPGHGDTKTDSHLTLPRVAKGRESLKRVEFLPFETAIRKKIPMLMTAHVVYKALDPKRPATLSPLILRDLLRKKMGYRGVVISDDLQMKAISKKFSEAQASLLALAAGCDLLLICRNGEGGREIIDEVARQTALDSTLKRRVEESFGRVHHLRKTYLK